MGLWQLFHPTSAYPHCTRHNNLSSYRFLVGISGSVNSVLTSHPPPSTMFEQSPDNTLTYLCPSLPVEHRPSTTPRRRTLFWAALVIPDQLVLLLFQLCFSVSPPTVARPASLPLPLRVPGQGLACGAGCWLPEGVSDPAPLSPQDLLSHWFLSRSLPQIFISDHLLPLDFADAPQTGVDNTDGLDIVKTAASQAGVAGPEIKGG